MSRLHHQRQTHFRFIATNFIGSHLNSKINRTNTFFTISIFFKKKSISNNLTENYDHDADDGAVVAADDDDVAAADAAKS